MKKNLLIAMSITALLSSCSIVSTVPSVLTKGVGAVAINYADGSATLNIANGDKGIRNVAFTVNADTKLTLTYAPSTAQCAYINGGTQVYCRLGDMTPFTSASVKFGGKIVAGKVGYINADNQTQTLEVTAVNPK